VTLFRTRRRRLIPLAASDHLPAHRRSVWGHNGRWAAAGFVTGLVAGAVAWSSAQHAYRKDLFNRHPVRRLAALGHLAGQPSVATVHLLREFIAWERRPALRARAVRVLRDVEQALV
jgi:hypothetical protein